MQISEILQQYQLPDIKAIDANGDTILHLVVENDELMPKETIEILGNLLKEGLDPNVKNKRKETIMHLAIAKRAKEVIEFLLARNVHFDDSVAAYLMRSEHDKTVDGGWKSKLPMSDSEWEKLENESTSFVEWCLSTGLNVDSRNSNGETGFFEAFDSQFLHVLPTLLKHTKDFDYVDCDSESTLLHTFLNNNAWSRKLNESSPREDWYSNYTRRHAPAVVRMMLEMGTSVDAVDFEGNTALHTAIRHDEDVGIIEMLIERSKNVDLKNAEGRTPFNCEISSWRWSDKIKAEDRVKICHRLISKGGDVNEPDDDGITPLGNAVRYHHLQAVEFLQKVGADFNVITDDGKTLLHLLAKESYNYKTDYDRKLQLFDLLISNGCKINAQDNTGNTTLHLAARNNDVVMVRKLIEHGAEIDVRNNEKETPFYYSVSNSQETDAAELLLQHGADINARDFEGFTALHATAARFNYQGKIEMLQFLLKNGADFNVRADRGYSVIHMALWQNYNENQDADSRIDLHELPSLARCTKHYVSNETQLLLKHWIKLHVARLKCHTDNDYKILIDKKKFKKYPEKCLAEVEMLKSTFIDSRASLYSVLHMDLNSRRAYIYNEKLQQLIQSPKLEDEFPEFSVLILSSHHEAVMRKRLMESAKKAWLQLTNISLPEECVELIFSFLSNSDLFDIIEKNEIDSYS